MHVCINFVCVFGWVGGLLGHVCVCVCMILRLLALSSRTT